MTISHPTGRMRGKVFRIASLTRKLNYKEPRSANMHSPWILSVKPCRPGTSSNLLDGVRPQVYLVHSFGITE
jgi:hypothetical protein